MTFALLLDAALLLALSRLLALALLGLHVATRPGFLLAPPAAWAEARLPDSLTRPLWTCPLCMASVYGTLVALLTTPQFAALHPVLVWLLMVAATAGWNLNALQALGQLESAPTDDRPQGPSASAPYAQTSMTPFTS
jgi:hypothetical protein